MPVQQNPVGLDIILVVVKPNGKPHDLTGASPLQVIARAPSGAVSTFTASLAGDGTDGRIIYTTVSGDLDESGTWQYQARVVFADGADLRSEITTLEISPNL